jgi:hypothetical protein
MDNAPDRVAKRQLDELGIKIQEQYNS